jgi:hypothetical protein
MAKTKLHPVIIFLLGTLAGALLLFAISKMVPANMQGDILNTNQIFIPNGFETNEDIFIPNGIEGGENIFIPNGFRSTQDIFIPNGIR